MQLSERHHAYWRLNLLLTGLLLLLWFCATFVASWYARELNSIDFIGPLGFYMGAQGAPIIYVLIILLYSRRMDALDDELERNESEND